MRPRVKFCKLFFFLDLFFISCSTLPRLQGPKFVSDEEIERIKAKIEEDNKAIAALDIKNERQKYGEKTWLIVPIFLFVPEWKFLTCNGQYISRKDATQR